jgi:predicted ATPase
MKARIEEIRIQNFWGIEDVRLTLSDLTFLVGRNGAGKSSILDAVELLREAVTDSLPNALNRRNGFDAVRRKGAGKGDPVGIAVELSAEIVGRRVRMLYGFRLAPDGANLHIEEVLRVAPAPASSTAFVRSGNSFTSDTSSRVAVPLNRLVLPLVVTDELSKIAFDAIAGMRAYEIDPLGLAAPAAIQGSTSLGKYGTNAGDVLEEVALRPAVYEALQATLGAVTPGVTGVASSVERGRRVINFVQRIGDEGRTFTADQMSQGTLRALGMLLALYQQPEPSLVLIDEVEDSIHPRALEAILDAVEEASERFPVVLTTHSPEVLSKRQVTPERIRIVQWERGLTRLYPLSEGTKGSIDPVTTVGDLLRIHALWPSDTAACAGDKLLELRA